MNCESIECVPGKLPDLNKRFSTITLKLWEKHGIKQAGFWTTVIGESSQTLYYMPDLGIAGRAREEVGRVRRRSGMADRAREDRGKRPDRRQCEEFHSGADAVFGGEVGAPIRSCPRARKPLPRERERSMAR